MTLQRRQGEPKFITGASIYLQRIKIWCVTARHFRKYFYKVVTFNVSVMYDECFPYKVRRKESRL